MPAAIYNLSVEKGVDYSISFALQRSNGEFVIYLTLAFVLHLKIVEFYGLEPITGFTITEILPSGVSLSLTEAGTLILPFDVLLL